MDNTEKTKKQCEVTPGTCACNNSNGTCSCGGKFEFKDDDAVTTFFITGMDCPTEETLVRKKLSSMSGVKSMEFNLMNRTLKVAHEPSSLEEISKALDSLDMGAKIQGSQPGSTAEGEPPAKWQALIIAGIAALGSEVVEAVYGGSWIVLALALVAIVIGGLTTYKKGWIALKNLNLNMNALMSFAVTGAVIIGQWPEAAMVMVLFSLAEFIEAKSVVRARNAIQKLLSITPEQATVMMPDGTWQEIAVKDVAVGSTARVKPGERIAMDGVISKGQSTVNQAPITGESLPVEKKEGDQVFAGTINESGSFEYSVTALAANSTLSRIIYAVEAAQGTRAPTQRFVDSFAKVYTPLVFVIALLVGLIPPLFLNQPWYDWAYKALVLLVIACPCALVISTPVSIVSGLAAATKHGILVKGGVYLEQGRSLIHLALDKTGTITYGKPSQTDFIAEEGADKDKTIQIAASLASRSDHPVSKAVAKAAQENGVQLLEVTDFAAVPGQGTRGIVEGQEWNFGNHRMVEGLNKCSADLERTIFRLEGEGKSVVVLIGGDGVKGVFAVADTIKETSKEAIGELRSLGVRTVMLTGDNQQTADLIGDQAGVDEVHGDMLPEDKLAQVEKLSQTGQVGMVGDGINDAPALAKADIGFAMGAAGTDTAIETADVALMDDDLRKIPFFIRLSKTTHNILVQNITMALATKALFLGLTMFGLTTMWMAVFADIGVSLIVVANGLRLLRK